MNIRNIILTAALCALPYLSVFAETTSSDIEAKVKATGLTYKTDSDGDFRLGFNMGEGRSQLVFVKGHTTTYKNAEFVEVFAIAVMSESRPVNRGQMRKLLSGEKHNLGHWCLQKPSSPGRKWILYYSIHLPVSASADEFEAAIRECASVADDKENDLVGTDDN